MHMPDNVGEFWIGRVVIGSDGNPGHVIGFSKNAVNELLIEVKFAAIGANGYREQLIHPSNITFPRS